MMRCLEDKTPSVSPKGETLDYDFVRVLMVLENMNQEKSNK